MKLLFLIAAIWTAGPALAQVATVRSGEHDVFSRLVIEAKGSTGWSFGRTDDGYALSLDGSDWRYDLTGVFDLIPRNRLAGIWAEPETGILRLGLGCACHAVPFEFRPGIIVIDLKDGPPPKGSSFEVALDGAPTQEVVPRPAMRPRPRPARQGAAYDWLLASRDRPSVTGFPLAPSFPESPDLAPLRNALLEQLGRGMAEGVLDRAEVLPKASRPPSPLPETSGMRVGFGALPGILAGADRAASGELLADGSACPTDSQLAIQDWGGATEAGEALAQSRSSLIGEFDRADPEAIMTSVRQLLHLGFGAEAIGVLAAFPIEGDVAEIPLLTGMARLVDGETDPQGAFAAMGQCASTAALWAALSTEVAPPGLRTDAVVRGFGNLPAPLRTHLGPLLVERLAGAEDPGAVEAIRKAILRAPGDPAPEVLVMDANLSLARGDADAAATIAETVLTDPRRATAEAMITLVESKVMQGQPVGPDVVTAVQALIEENAGGELLSDLQQTLVLAQAGAGNFSAARAALADSPQTTPRFWSMLASQGTDSDILAEAVLAAGQVAPTVDIMVSQGLAERLLGLGFADAALQWLSLPEQAADERTLILAARAELLRRDGRAALRRITGLDSVEAAEIRAAALTQLGDPAGAAQALTEAGQVAESERVRLWAQDWPGLSKDAPDLWQSAARALADDTAAAELGDGQGASSADGPLARSAALLERSAAERAAFADLLNAVAGPQPAP